MPEYAPLTRGKTAQALGVAALLVFWAVVSQTVVVAAARSQWQDYHLLRQMDQVTVGEYVSAEYDLYEGYEQEYEISDYFLRYEYTVDGETYFGRTLTTPSGYLDFQPGRQTEVRYVQNAPEVSRAGVTPSIAPAIGTTMFLGMWTGLVVLVLYGFVWRSTSLRAIVYAWSPRRRQTSWQK